MLKPELRKEIEDDIKLCTECIDQQLNTCCRLCEKLTAKYTAIDSDFSAGMPLYRKIYDADFYAELDIIREKLNMYLILDDIPIHRNENVASNAVIINGDKNKIKGNVGQGNKSEQKTDISLGINQEKKSLFGWLKKIFGGK